MAGQQSLSTAIAERQAQAQQPAQGPNTMGAMLDRMAPEFAKVLAPRLPTETFMRLALTEVRNNPRLLECSQASLLGALMTAARLNLEPGGPLGQFYLTPRRIYVPATGRKEWQVVPIIGYRGLRDLALRTGLVTSVQSFIVREGDRFEMGSNETRGFWHEWEPADTDEDESDRPAKGVLTIAQLPSGGKPVWRYLTKTAVMARKAAGAAGDSGPWATFEEAMWRKTGIRAIANDLPSSSIMREAVLSDERVQTWRVGDTHPHPAEIEAGPEAGLDQQTGEVPTTNPEPPAPEQPQEKPAQRGRRRAPQAAASEVVPVVERTGGKVVYEEQQQPAQQGMPAPPPPDLDVIPVEDPPSDGEA